ncbi:LL-diaminopimelate aminotransferase [Roseofilum reptotaenium CS-1145]|uniref:Aminotransferase n=1 Tax=Roseofilum reptotaenium AO1-A TaxID=1925591 RepID=A0A1L9QVT8_9CYAN|nr:LL-diaminopimelate aminotransferase [Roseofilum reptotaenium]MDB9518121.1 LL-diaminopimelate aminotransferase [Roseofilum reptotaenium CS-1145]OJJ26805.1 LL-diaminopimelate aminotransferase [Roseofilum reptotaenium AO1-A]
MASKNIYLSQLTGDATYTQIVFNKVWGKVEADRAAYPEKKVFMMAFGDTSQPLPPTVVQGLVNAATRLGDRETYTGYEDVTGNPDLRHAICTNYYQKKLGIDFDPAELFVTDGAQSVSVNIQELFAPDNVVAIPNPAYPSFVEGTLLASRKLVDLPCHESDNFVPKLPQENVDIIYLCFPNNPTGSVATREQLQYFVDYAIARQAVIIFDAAYSAFITTPNIPKSIYEIEGAKKCAIEIGSFSKMANFTGLRVGWCVIPHSLMIQNTVPGELNDLWRIRHCVKFWGTANISQQGAIAALSETGQLECQEVVNYYLKNAGVLRQGLEKSGFQCFGGIDSPFVWLKATSGLSSWQFFEKMLQSTGIVGVPGCVFGNCGETYLRLAALGHREEIEGAVENADKYFK